jgi:general stress protein 26
MATSMTKDEVIDLIQDSGYGILATMDGDMPRARPMMPYLNEDGNLLLAVLSNSRTILQIKKNPKVEICYLDRKMCFARVSGKGKVSEDLKKKEIVWNNIPMLRQYFSGPDDEHYVLIEIETETVEAMTPHHQKPDVLSLK